MNLKMGSLGAEPKKALFLGALVLLGAYFYFSSGSGAPAGSSATVASSAGSRVPAPGMAEPLRKMPVRTARARGSQRGSSGGSFLEFRPSLKPRKDVEVDRAGIDPTLKLDRLEKLRSIGVEGGRRSLFEESQGQAAVLAIKEPPKVIVSRFVGPMQALKEVAAVKPPEPPPPPIALKFYGFISPRSAGVKRAFFLDGDDIIVATEGQMVKSRYRIVRIGVNSAVVEDTQFKNNQQTLPLVEEQTG